MQLESILSVTQVPGDGVTVALEFLVTGKLSQIRKEKFHIIRVTVTFFSWQSRGLSEICIPGMDNCRILVLDKGTSLGLV